MPKGNPYHVSKNTEVILIKERKDVVTSSRAVTLTSKSPRYDDSFRPSPKSPKRKMSKFLPQVA